MTSPVSTRCAKASSRGTSIPGPGLPQTEQTSKLFHTFEHTAFRLETRDEYYSPNETKALEQFVAGEPVGLVWLQSWLTMIREATAEGRQFARVRVVSMPLTDYSRFGVFCSEHTNAAGEDIRYLTRDQAEDLPDQLRQSSAIDHHARDR